MVDQPTIHFDKSEVLARIRDSRRDSSWVREHMKELRKEYPRKFIAVRDRKIIDGDSSFEALLKRVKRKVEDLGTVSFEFVPDEDYIYVL